MKSLELCAASRVVWSHFSQYGDVRKNEAEKFIRAQLFMSKNWALNSDNKHKQNFFRAKKLSFSVTTYQRPHSLLVGILKIIYVWL